MHCRAPCGSGPLCAPMRSPWYTPKRKPSSFLSYCFATIRGVARNLLRGENRGCLGDGSPPAGSRGRAPVGVWGDGEAPRSHRKMLISSCDGGTCTHVPLATPLATIFANVLQMFYFTCNRGLRSLQIWYIRSSCRTWWQRWVAWFMVHAEVGKHSCHAH